MSRGGPHRRTPTTGRRAPALVWEEEKPHHLPPLFCFFFSSLLYFPPHFPFSPFFTTPNSLTSITMGSLSNQPGTFLFTSESVGEGHPDKIAFVCP